MNDPNLRELLIDVFKRFAHGSDPYSGHNSMGALRSAGGGGEVFIKYRMIYILIYLKDIETAKLVIETLSHLSYYFKSDDELINQYFTPNLLITDLIEKTLVNGKLPIESIGQLLSLKKRISRSNPKHIMISYSWKVCIPYYCI